MRIKWIGSAFVCMTFAFACGGGDGGSDGSGVDPDTLVTELEPDESEAICEYSADLNGPAREIDCGDGVTVNVEAVDVAECAAGLDSIGEEAPDCPATVGEFEACLEDLAAFSDDELCDDGTALPASCDLIFNDPDC
jgi:hypothetical protein